MYRILRRCHTATAFCLSNYVLSQFWRVKPASQQHHSLRPIFPKHTQLTNNTLAIQVATPTLSWLKRIPAISNIPLCSCWYAESVPLAREDPGVLPGAWGDGDGTRSGLMDRSSAVPEREKVAERMKPGAVRSRRYQIAGFARAKVRESWRVDCQASRRCGKKC